MRGAEIFEGRSNYRTQQGVVKKSHKKNYSGGLNLPNIKGINGGRSSSNILMKGD